MIRAVLIFLLLLVSVWLGIQLQHDPGYLLIAIHQWTMETTVWVAIIALILAFILLHTVLLILHWFIHLPTSWRSWRTKRRVQYAQATTSQGLIEFSEGHWQQARNHLIKALPDTETPLLNYLTAARAAQEMGDNKLRDDYLREAQQSMPEAKIAVELTQAQLQLANHQWEQALATLRHLQDLAPHHPYVLKLLMQLYIEVKDWGQLIILLPELKHHKVILGNHFTSLQHEAYLQAMIDLIKQDQSQALLDFIAVLPKNLRDDAELMIEYNRYLLTKHQETKAEKSLRHCLSKKFNEQLINIYGHIRSNNSQLDFAESLLKTQPHSAALFLCLGRLAKAQNLWGKAKMYFEQSIEFGATPETYLELGQLLEQLSDQEAACIAYQKGLILATKEP